MRTFPSDEEYWAWLERQARFRERLWRAARNSALFAAATLVLFAVLWLFVRNMGAGRYDAWQNTIDTIRSVSG